MTAAQDVLIEALLGAGDVAKFAAAQQLVALSEHDDTKVDSIAPLLELARRGRALPAQLAVVALERLALSDDGMKVRIAAAGGVEVLFELLWRPDGRSKERAANALVSLGPYVNDFTLVANNFTTLALQIDGARGVDFDLRVALAVHKFTLQLGEHLIQCNAELEAPIVEADARVLKFQTDAYIHCVRTWGLGYGPDA